jgi:Domain of unknown function (DUF3883)
MAYATLATLRRLTHDLRLALKRDLRTAALLRPPVPAPVETDTGGHSVTIAQVAKGLNIDLWLDMYAALPSPRPWVGFYSSSRSKIMRLVSLSTSAGLGDDLIRRSARHTRRVKRVWQFTRPLSPNEFDVQLLESYGSGFYLGIYMPYPWPLSRKSERAIVRDALNYIAALAPRYMLFGESGAGVTGWSGRPDKVVEKAAIKYVKARLRHEGYSVRSRESEYCGYDLHAVRGGKELHVEVKGVSGETPRFYFTRNELKTAARDTEWRLAIVLNALTRPQLKSYVRGNRLKHLFAMEPIQWFVTRRGLRMA